MGRFCLQKLAPKQTSAPPSEQIWKKLRKQQIKVIARWRYVKDLKFTTALFPKPYCFGGKDFLKYIQLLIVYGWLGKPFDTLGSLCEGSRL